MVNTSKQKQLKAKKGQILVLVLMLMAVGMIVVAPLLHYLNTSYNILYDKLDYSLAYQTADAMIQKIFADMYAGDNIYVLNLSDSTRYNNDSDWLNGYQVHTSINNSINGSVPPPVEETGWIYLDPGCDQGLNTLAYNGIHQFKLYLSQGTTVNAHWYFADTKGSCTNYWAIGRMWITNASGTVAGSSTTDLLNGVSTPFSQNVSYTVPTGANGNYTINYQNLAKRLCSGTNYSRSMSDMTTKPFFSGVGAPTYTWVSLGNEEGGAIYQFQDFTIDTTVSRHNTDLVRITICMRQIPGPVVWWEDQSLEVKSWIICYDPPTCQYD